MSGGLSPAPHASSTVAHVMGWLCFRETRRSVRGWRAWLAVTAVAGIVGVLSLWVGGMLTIFPIQGIYTVEVIWWGSIGWWFYPELLVVQPWGILQLPWFPTLTMGLVSGAAGIGTVASAGLVRQYFTARRQHRTGAPIGGVAAGAGPGVISFATLGACCCTSCTTTGSLALVAAVSGTSTAGLLELDWFMPLFQLAVVYLALLAQERAIRLSRQRALLPPVLGPRLVASIALRLVLLVGGITWSLAMFVEWGSTDPATASMATWYHWLFEHQLLAGLAIAAAVFPEELARLARWITGRVAGRTARVVLAVAAFTWGVGVPPALTALGLGGLVNELLEGVGPGGPSPTLLFHWLIQHGALSAYAMVFALRPRLAVHPLGWSTARSAEESVASPPTVPGPRPSEMGDGTARIPAPALARAIGHEADFAGSDPVRTNSTGASSSPMPD